MLSFFLLFFLDVAAAKEKNKTSITRGKQLKYLPNTREEMVSGLSNKEPKCWSYYAEV